MLAELFSVSLFAVLIGFRHGMDSDHIAAIADMVGSERERKRQLQMGITYALGHGSIVAVIGSAAIILGTRLPQGLLDAMELLVGYSLLFLGGFILYSICRQKEEYHYQSRWEILYEMAAKLFNRRKKEAMNVSRIGVFGAFAVGVIHGVGAETPTQVVLISSSVGLDNTAAAVVQLFLFTFGLLVATILVTYLASWGFLKAGFKRVAFIFLGLITGSYSVLLGISIIFRL